ncbi:signal peptide serine peptidase A [Desulfuromonas soudanensis]|uniref:Signal peptide serine peptidase A n=1 Tax=Desulfuromonas soudanensis TaxID=1603606 RepID=A0A0M4CW71_9BACT|nr:signal peptide peptidase SppA [Desulfuromonas soudanensis]ALC16166.1 signal peptide serine peptidase A [Desulfuromonas soudanensis]
MKKNPFLMALLTLGAIFLFFVLVVVAAGFVGRGRGLPIGEKIGVIEMTGIIVASKTTIEHIIEFRNNPSIKGIVLRVDSPGGGVGPSQEIYEEIKKTVAVKPVVVSMGSVAASGGYYVSAPVNRIFANPGTITGSIGVIMEFTNVQELLGKIGLKNQVIKSGEHKDIGSPVRPMTDSDRQILQSLIDDTQQQFVAAVAEGRKMTVADVEPLADGRVFTGRQALAVGLVDELGNLQDAISAAARMAGIEGEPRVVYPPEEKPGVFQYLIQESATQLRRGLQEQSATGLQFIWSGVE